MNGFSNLSISGFVTITGTLLFLAASKQTVRRGPKIYSLALFLPSMLYTLRHSDYGPQFKEPVEVVDNLLIIHVRVIASNCATQDKSISEVKLVYIRDHSTKDFDLKSLILSGVENHGDKKLPTLILYGNKRLQLSKTI